jgi:outer membrane protein OmpA-like peptidoglycan-associated protein
MKSDVLFDTDSAVVKPGAVDRVVQVGDILAKYPDDRVRVEGHADRTGTVRHNEELSQRRADAVRKLLLSRGVAERQVVAAGMGSTEPVATNATAAGRARNRRVELHIDVPNPS